MTHSLSLSRYRIRKKLSVLLARFQILCFGHVIVKGTMRQRGL